MENRIERQDRFRMLRFREFGVLIVLFGIVVILSFAAPVFLNPLNIINVVRQAVEIAIMAIGMTFVIVSAEIDLSVGSVFGATAMIAAYIIKAGADPGLAFLAALAVGAGIGFMNGFLTTKMRMPAFIVTLGAMQIFRSVAFSISNGKSLSAFPNESLSSWVFKIGGNIGAIPVQVIIMIGLYVIAIIALKKTRFGFETYATGGNQRAALLAGINTDKIKMTAFMISGAVCAVAAIISIAFLKSVPTTAGQGREMDVIAAVILGGAALTGGRGSMLGTVLGAVIMSVIKNGMVLLSVPVFWQSGFIGVVIIFAVLLDTQISKSGKTR